MHWSGGKLNKLRMSNSEIADAVIIMRHRALRHGEEKLWELIFAAEALLRGEPTLYPRERIVAEIEKELQGE